MSTSIVRTQKEKEMKESGKRYQVVYSDNLTKFVKAVARSPVLSINLFFYAFTLSAALL